MLKWPKYLDKHCIIGKWILYRRKIKNNFALGFECSPSTSHVEAVRVVYDPSIIEYPKIIQYFFEIHDFTQVSGQGGDIGDQYLSKIFYFNNDLMKIFSGLIFIFAGITDFLDGYLARYWKAHSMLGRILDPIADKLIVVAAIVMLIFHNKIEGLNIFAAMAILLREVIISGLREALS
ncbi:MAG: peptide-methionine (S)-S-oxide reductase, partial [Dolichospermum sp.]|nr:peptide-methionine (S)-S-oxide reductase [Dolichospermum sp.]